MYTNRHAGGRGLCSSYPQIGPHFLGMDVNTENSGFHASVSATFHHPHICGATMSGKWACQCVPLEVKGRTELRAIGNVLWFVFGGLYMARR